MSEPSYPVLCQHCSESIYGPVNYCPYCGQQLEPVEGSESAGNSQDAELGQADSDKKARSNVQVTVSSAKPPAAIPPGKSINKPKDILSPEIEIAESTGEPGKGLAIFGQDPILRKWLWLMMALLIGGFLYYLVLLIHHPKNFPQPSPSRPTNPVSPAPQTSNHGKREAARILALEALRQGTVLSVTISKLPKQERVLQAAKRLRDISPRYQTQVAMAESSLLNARNKMDKALVAYLNKVLELGRYSQNQTSYALETIQNGDLTARERIVSELLDRHLNCLRNEGRPDPKLWLSDFRQRFIDYVD